jgi:hypothetical protein
MNKRTCFQLIGRRATDSRSGAAETRTGAAKGDPGQGEKTVRGAEEEVSNGSTNGKVKRRVELEDGDSYVAVMQSLPPFVVRAAVGRNTSVVLTLFLHNRG